ncbi:MAG: GNAT family N-acetyltransferase [Chloroflexi bacterium]|nr:GNAT family N-acetyltransferase [Chloroflexota bacterium]
MNIHPVTLSRRNVRLEPLTVEHVPDLSVAGADESIWKNMLFGMVTSEEKMYAWVEEMLTREMSGTDLPFAVIHLESGRAIGATRYMNINVQHRTLEIGGTWYGVKYQRTTVDVECKYLLLKHAFEALGCIRVQFETDIRNTPSQRAIERLGATREGVLRNHMIRWDGTYRDSIYYSIIESEWPDVKARLRSLLDR